MTVHCTEYSRIGNANIINNRQTDGNGAIQVAKGAVANYTLATTETSDAFNDATRMIRVHAVNDSLIAVGGADVDASTDPATFLGAGTFDYFAVDPSQYLNVVDAYLST